MDAPLTAAAPLSRGLGSPLATALPPLTGCALAVFRSPCKRRQALRQSEMIHAEIDQSAFMQGRLLAQIASLMHS